MLEVGVPTAVAARYFAQLRTKLVLEPDSLEVRGVWRTQNARRSELRGWREFSNRNGRWVELYRSEGLGKFSVPGGLEGQDELRDWLRASPGSVPNLDEQDAAEIVQQIERELGSTGVAGHPLLGRAKIIQASLTGALISLGIGASLDVSRALSMAALWVFLLAPWVAMLLMFRSPLLWTAFRPSPDPRVKLEAALLLPAFFVWRASEAARTAHLVHSMQLMGWVVLAGVVYAGMLMRWALGSVKKVGAVLLVLLCAGLYGAGAARSADVLADHSTALWHTTTVIEKRQTQGKGAANYVRLAPWGGLSSVDEASVRWAFYKKVAVGEPVCVRWHPGALRAAWYTVAACPKRP